MPYMAQILHVPYSCLDFNLTNLQIVVCSGGCKTAVVPMALVQGVTPTYYQLDLVVVETDR
jgi:hypothetical protein